MAKPQLFINPKHSSSNVLLVFAYAAGAIKKGNILITSVDDLTCQALKIDQSVLPLLMTNRGGVSGAKEIAVEISKFCAVYKNLYPTELSEESALVDEYIAKAVEWDFDISKDPSAIQSLSNHLTFRTFISGGDEKEAVRREVLTAADLFVFASVQSWLSKAGSDAVQGLIPLLRWYNHIQSLDGLRDGCFPLVAVAELYTKKKEGVVKQAQAKTQVDSKSQAATDNRPLDDPTRLELRVGVIVDVWEHPEADGLYCERIDIGEAEPRLIASGLRKFVPIEEMKGRKIIVFANLKEKALKGFKSHGMVMCASNEDHSAVELCSPPAESKAGDLVIFEGLTGVFEPVLSNKKNADALTAILPGLHGDHNGIAFYKTHKLLVNGSPITCPTLKECHLG